MDQECKLSALVLGRDSTLVPGFLEWDSAHYDWSRSTRVLLQSRLDMPGRAASDAIILYAPHMPCQLECRHRNIQRFWHIYSISTPLSHGSQSLVQTSAAFPSSVFYYFKSLIKSHSVSPSLLFHTQDVESNPILDTILIVVTPR